MVDISRGQRPSEIFTTEDRYTWYSMERVCNNSLIIHLHRISRGGGGGGGDYDEEGKEMKKERKRGGGGGGGEVKPRPGWI